MALRPTSISRRSRKPRTSTMTVISARTPSRPARSSPSRRRTRHPYGGGFDPLGQTLGVRPGGQIRGSDPGVRSGGQIPLLPLLQVRRGCCDLISVYAQRHRRWRSCNERGCTTACGSRVSVAKATRKRYLPAPRWQSAQYDARWRWFVPGRIEVLGKHTDYAGGRSLICAAERGMCVVAAPRSDAFIRIADAIRGEALEVPLSPRSRR